MSRSSADTNFDRRMALMEAASSGSEMDSSDDDDSEAESLSNLRRRQPQQRFGDDEDEDSDAPPAAFEDLPTDDSDSGDSDDDSNDSENDAATPSIFTPNVALTMPGADSDEDIHAPLSERVARNAELGRVRKRPPTTSDGANPPSSFKRKLLEMKSKQAGKMPEDEKVEKKKRSKHAPLEQSSSRKTFFATGAPTIGGGIKSTFRTKGPVVDPRFNSLSGNLNQHAFEQSYDFLQEIEEKEIKTLKEKNKAAQVKGKKGQKLRKKLGVDIENTEEDKERLSTLLNQRGERNKSQVVRNAKSSVKRAIAARVSEGGAAYYPKQREIKKMEAEARYDELKKKGGQGAVKKALEKRRKKNSAKDKKLLPARTQG